MGRTGEVAGDDSLFLRLHSVSWRFPPSHRPNVDTCTISPVYTAPMGRPLIQVRVSPAWSSAIDTAALRDGVDRSVYTRRLLAFALEHMPADWGVDIADPVSTDVSTPASEWMPRDEDDVNPAAIQAAEDHCRNLDVGVTPVEPEMAPTGICVACGELRAYRIAGVCRNCYLEPVKPAS